jgi:hypothetical protein
VAITLLALSPIVLPSGTPLGRLPSPLVGAEQIGRVVASALRPPAEKRESATPPRTTAPPVSEVSAPETASESGTGLLPAPAARERGEPRRERSERPSRPKEPAPAVSPRSQPTKSEVKAERRAERAEVQAERRAERAEAKAEQNEERAERQEEKQEKKDQGDKGDKADKKEKPKEKGHGSGGSKKSDHARDEGGKRHS